MYKIITVDRQRFFLAQDPRTGAPYIDSIHPYDETEYHWARQGAQGSCWFVFREGRRVGTLGRLAPEAVAAELLNRDRAAGLTRTGGIW